MMTGRFDTRHSEQVATAKQENAGHYCDDTVTGEVERVITIELVIGPPTQKETSKRYNSLYRRHTKWVRQNELKARHEKWDE
jgi:hypothetical protein